MRNYSILLVEDDLSVRAFFCMALRYLGFQVTECGDVGSALESLSVRAPSLVLVDRNLPLLSGTQLVKMVAGREGWGVPVVGMSGHHHWGAEMLKAGAKAFITKPVEIKNLKAELMRIIQTAGFSGQQETQ